MSLKASSSRRPRADILIHTIHSRWIIWSYATLSYDGLLSASLFQAWRLLSNSCDGASVVDADSEIRLAKFHVRLVANLYGRGAVGTSLLRQARAGDVTALNSPSYKLRFRWRQRVTAKTSNSNGATPELSAADDSDRKRFMDNVDRV
jgi:hypothetical protein